METEAYDACSRVSAFSHGNKNTLFTFYMFGMTILETTINRPLYVGEYFSAIK